MTVGTGVMPAIAQYWSRAVQDKGRPKGPVHMVAQLFQRAGIAAPTPVVWDLPEWPGCDIRKVIDFRVIALDIARQVVWNELSAKRRHYRGIWAGIDMQATLRFAGRIKNEVTKAKMMTILSDGVWTQTRVTRRGICQDKRIRCGKPRGNEPTLRLGLRRASRNRPRDDA